VQDLMFRIHIATEFSATPGPRYIREGSYSGELFRSSLLLPLFDKAVAEGKILFVNLDGGYGYSTSFLEESFGGLARERGIERVLTTLQFASEEEPYLIEDIKRYIRASVHGPKR
jgi:STAS-like domain of unknown function (DUF4325)